MALWFIPFLVFNLGASRYGLVPLAVTLTSYMSIITVSIRSAFSRDLMFSLAGDNSGDPNTIFNSALVGILTVALTLTIASAFLVIFIEHVITIPKGLESETTYLIGLTCVAFIITTIASAFSASANATHRLDLINWMEMAAAIGRVGLVAITFWLFIPNLLFVGIGAIVAATIQATCALTYWKRLTPTLSVRLKKANRRVSLRLLATGSWTVIGQLGTILLTGIELLLVNRIFGPNEGGLYALALQWAILIRMLFITTAGTFTPTITQAYANRKCETTRKTTVNSIKFVGLIISIPIGFICGFSSELLSVWIGNEYQSLSFLVILLSGPLILHLPLTPIFALALAADKIRMICGSTLLLGIVNPFLAWILAVHFNFGLFGIAASSSLLYAVRSLVIDLPLANKINKGTGKEALQAILYSCIVVTVVFMTCRGLCLFLIPDSWVDLTLAAVVISFVLFPFLYFCFTSRYERDFLKGLISRKP